MSMENRKKVIFCDRDGVIVVEDQVDSFEKIIYIPHVFEALREILKKCDYELVLVSNQDGVDTPSFPLKDFESAHNRIIETLGGEGIVFDQQFIDYSLPSDNCPGRKPGTAMLSAFMKGGYDLENSFMIGDRATDMQLAANIGCKGIWLTDQRIDSLPAALQESVALVTSSWLDIADFLTLSSLKSHRRVSFERMTKETQIAFELDIDGSGKGTLKSGIGFFDHMLEQVFKHARFDVKGTIQGDLEVDEHHTAEDVAICLGSAVKEALGDKRGINRYGYDVLMMDDVVATVAIDFSSRPALLWDVDFGREAVGGFPTELFQHFFKSFSDEAKCNIYVKVSQGNTHHQAEAIFKCFAHAMKNAVKRIPGSSELPSTKGVL